MRTYGNVVVMDDGDDIHEVIKASPEGARILLPAVVTTDRALRPKRGQHLQGQSPAGTILGCTSVPIEVGAASDLIITEAA